jgi:nitrite reductase (NO-forming)/hydroxylamine reductase
VAAIVSSHYNPEFFLNVKETGMVYSVDYRDLKNLKHQDDRGCAVPA